MRSFTQGAQNRTSLISAPPWYGAGPSPSRRCSKTSSDHRLGLPAKSPLPENSVLQKMLEQTCPAKGPPKKNRLTTLGPPSKELQLETRVVGLSILERGRGRGPVGWAPSSTLEASLVLSNQLPASQTARTCIGYCPCPLTDFEGNI